MRIGLKEVLNIVSTKTGIDKRYITFQAWFHPTDVDLGKDSSKSTAKWVCIEEFYKYPSQRGLTINIYAKGYEIFSFFAQDIEPYTNNIYDLMGVKYNCSCVGPGFYSYCPYLILDGDCDKKDIKKFMGTISFDPNKTKVDFYPNVKRWDLKANHKAYLQSLPANALGKSFFKDIECAKSIETNTVEKTDPELTL